MNQSALISKLKNGEAQAFNEIVASCQDMIYNTALSLLQQEQEAEDITQEVFIQLYHSIAEFREEAALSTWLYKVTVSKSMDALRKKQREKRGGWWKRLTGAEASEEAISFQHPGVLAENKEKSAVLWKAINRLPESQRVAFTLQKMEGLSMQDIADVMEKSVDSVESLLARARKNLRDHLADYYVKTQES